LRSQGGGGNNSNHISFPPTETSCGFGLQCTYNLLHYFPNVWHLIQLHLLAKWPHSSPQNTQRTSASSCTSSLSYSTSELKSLICYILLPFAMFLLFAHLNCLFPISVSFSPSALNILLQSQTTDLLIHILRSCFRA